MTLMASTTFKDMLRSRLPKGKDAWPLESRDMKLINVFPDLQAQFTIVGRIGAGRYGEIYEALEKANGRRFAIKIGYVPLDTFFTVEKTMKRIHREVEIGESMKTAHIGPIVYSHDSIEKDQGTDDHTIFFYIVMEYIDGETLLSWLDRMVTTEKRRDQCGKIEEDPILQASIVLAARLYIVAMKHGVLQNDLKASNIMLDVNGNAFLIDYGQSARIEEDDDMRKNFARMKGIFTTSLKQESIGLIPYHMKLMEYWPDFNQLVRERTE